MELGDISNKSIWIGLIIILLGYGTQLIFLRKSKDRDAGIYLKTLESSNTLIVGGFLLIFLGLLVETLRILAQ